jgi:exopolysaccharide biosynthesis polyprenyl glycosylphosphotransferase
LKKYSSMAKDCQHQSRVTKCPQDCERVCRPRPVLRLTSPAQVSKLGYNRNSTRGTCMIREQNNYFLPLLALLDLASILIAYAISASQSCALWGCRHAPSYIAIDLPFTLSHYLHIAPLVIIMPLLFLVITGSYRHTGTRMFRRILQSTGSAVAVSALCLLSMQFLYPALVETRVFLALFFSLSWFGFIINRWLLARIIRGVRGNSTLIQHVLIVGIDASALEAAEVFQKQCPWGIRVAGYLSNDPADIGRTIGAARVLNTIENFDEVINHHVVDSVLLISSVTNTDTEAIRTLAMLCETRGIDFSFSSSAFTRYSAFVTAEHFEGFSTISLRSVGLRPEKLFFKRLFDILASLSLIVLLTPFWIIIPAWIRRNSPGPALFCQERVGRHGRLFMMYKFRTMVVGADQMVDQVMGLNEMDGPVFKIKNDPRFTGIGQFLRTTSIDELPQLFNVLKGDMSLVGPRPPLIKEVAQYLPWQRKRLSVMPGITCLWQVTGRNEIKFDEWMQLDLQYIENWSLVLDCKILLRTATAVLSRRGAE